MQNKPLPVGRGLCYVFGLGAFPPHPSRLRRATFSHQGGGRLPPLSGGDVERSETEGVGDLAEGQTDEGEGKGLPRTYKLIITDFFQKVIDNPIRMW